MKLLPNRAALFLLLLTVRYYLTGKSLDDVTDFIHSAADFILIYRIEQPTQRAKRLADVIVSSTLEMQKAIGLLTNQIDQTQILKHCVEINRMENEADIIYRTALVELFANTTDENC